jgi:hypothetical protein
MAVTYTAPQYDDSYRKRIENQVGAAYDAQKTAYNAQAEKDRATQLGEAQKNQQSALKQAYITRLQNQQRLNQNLAQSGIRGGMTETANLNLANQYGQARAAANSDYTNSVNQINQSIDRNKFEYGLDVDSRKEEAIQNQANAMWQAAREDSLNEWNARQDYWNNYYLDFYSGYSKAQLKKAYEQAKKEYQATSDPAEKQRYLQMIRGIRNRQGVIANK